MKFIQTLLSVLILEFGFIILYAKFSKKIYLANSKKDYFKIGLSSIVTLLLPIIIIDQLFYHLFGVYTEGLYWSYVGLATLGIIIKPIIIDVILGDIIYDYYFCYENDSLFNFGKYLEADNTLYTIRQICRKDNMKCFTISAYENNNSGKLFFIDQRYYVLIDRKSNQIINKIDIYDIQKKNVNEIKTLSDYRAIIQEQYIPFEIFIRFEMDNNRILDLDITIKEQDNNILIESSKTLKRAN